MADFVLELDDGPGERQQHDDVEEEEELWQCHPPLGRLAAVVVVATAPQEESGADPGVPRGAAGNRCWQIPIGGRTKPGDQEGTAVLLVVPVPHPRTTARQTRTSSTASSRRRRTRTRILVVVRVLLAIMMVVLNVRVVGWLGWRGQQLRATTTMPTTRNKGNQSTTSTGVAEEGVKIILRAEPDPDTVERAGSTNPQRTSPPFNATRPMHETIDSQYGSGGILRDDDVGDGPRPPPRRRRSPKRSPHHVYQCGVYRTTSLVTALFPDANATNLHRELPAGGPRSVTELIQSFQRDDVLLVTCGGTCVIPFKELLSTFLGPILQVTGESSLRHCLLPRVATQDGAVGEKQRVISLTRIGSPIDRWNESTFNVALLIASKGSSSSSSTRDVFYNRPDQRPRNTGKHFLIYISSHCVPYREEAFRTLSTLGGEVHYAGKCDGGENSTAVVRVQDHGGRHQNKWLYRDYRFTLAMENAAVPGYITEKIMVPFLSGSVPIYYGTIEVFDIFNRNAFVWYDIHNPQPALERIQYLESNRSAYDEMLRQPILANGEETIAKYFSIRDEDGGGRLKWAIRDRIGFG